MPSIYNNENSCWGVKRTYIRPNLGLFQHEFSTDVNQTTLDIKTSQASAISNGSASMTTTDVPRPTDDQTKPVCFSISSNGYYGYQPHNQLLPCNKTSDSNTDNEMDVDESEFTVNYPVTACSLKRTFGQINQETFTLDRKRHFHEDDFYSGIKKPKHSGRPMCFKNNV